MPEADRQSVYRILDANANRAREALRVAEEAARFALERADLAEALKRLRHDLRAALGPLDAQAMLRARDAAGDVGTAIATPEEARRDSTVDVARAAFKRLAESLRVLEEYAKVVSADAAAAVERLRYRAYDLEKRFEEALEPSRRLAAGGVCILLTESLCRKGWQEVLRGALAGGAACVQVREKKLPDRRLLDRARTVVEAAHQAGALVIINDRPDVAALAGADGVHVGQDDLPPGAARRVVGPERIVGQSTHSLEQALAAAEAGADYVGCGPMFQSQTKPQPRVPGPALCAEVARGVGLPRSREHLSLRGLPVMAVGGITPEHAGEVLAAGAAWLAVSGAVCGAEDPEAETRRLVEALAAHRATAD